MINPIHNGDQPLPVIAPVSLVRTAQNASPTLKDPKFWTAEEKKTRKVDRLARSLLIQGLPNDIYSLIESNETAKDLWDALERNNDEDINDMKKITALLAKAFNRKKYYAKPTNNNLRTSLASSSANKKPKYVKSVEKKENKRADEKKRDMSKVKCYNCKKERHFTKDCKKAKVKDFNYYKSKMLLAKKDSDEQVLLADDQAWMDSSSDFDQKINANMVFMAQIEKVLSDSDKSSSSAEETILRLCDSFDENNLFIFDDESVRISHVSKMPFRKKPRDSINVCSMSNSNKSLPRTVHRWLPKMQPEKFLGTVRFGNTDFAVIAGYGDVVIGSMTIKNVYYVEGLGHNLFSIGQFCDKGLEVTFRKSTCFVRNEDGQMLLLRNLGCGINNLVKNNLVQGLSKMKFEKDHLCFACEEGKIHQKHHLSKTAFASNKPLYLLHMNLCGLMRVESINGKQYVLVVVDDYSRYTWVFFLHSKDEASEVIISFIKKTQVNLQLQVQRVRTDNGTKFKNKTLAKFFDELKEKGDIIVFVGYSKESSAFRIYNKRTRKIHESVNVNFYEISEMASKQLSLEPSLSNLNETGKSSNAPVSQVSETSKKYLEDLFHNFYDEYFDASKIIKSSTTKVESSNVEVPSHEEEVFHESSKSFQEEYSSSVLNDDVQQSSEEVGVPSSNTQSISNNMIPNVDEASTSHNVFNERLDDAYLVNKCLS
nr:hypothetical protein [Tanacetum cinerariifolium]